MSRILRRTLQWTLQWTLQLRCDVGASFFISLCLAFLGFVCGGDARAANSVSRGFDVNDTFFFLPTTQNFEKPMYPDIRLSDVNTKDARPLVGIKLYRSIVDQFLAITEGSVGASFKSPNMTKKEYPYFRVTNIRFDPCFPGPQVHPEKCVQHIRLVVTPIDDNDNPRIEAHAISGGRIEFLDYSVHLLYKVGSGLPEKDHPLVKELMEIMTESDRTGISTAGRPLTVHPGLAREMEIVASGQEGPLAKRVRAFVLDHVSEANLVEATVTNGDSSDGFEGRWNFVGGLVQNGVWKPRPIPRLGTERVQVSAMFGFMDPAPKSGPQILSSQNGEPTKNEIEGVYQILNPEKTNPVNTDCASCHLAAVKGIELARKGVVGPILGAFVMPKGITGFADPKFRVSSLDSDNVRVIGYLGGSPTVTSLAANSSALVAQTINVIQGLPPPTTLDCRSPVVRACFDGVDEKGAVLERSAEDCLKLCK